jgi:hypothetical protein
MGIKNLKGGRMDRCSFTGRASMPGSAAFVFPAILNWKSSAQAPVPDIVAETTTDKLYGIKHNGTHVFKGIPYDASASG